MKWQQSFLILPFSPSIVGGTYSYPAFLDLTTSKKANKVCFHPARLHIAERVIIPENGERGQVQISIKDDNHWSNDNHGGLGGSNIWTTGVCLMNMEAPLAFLFVKLKLQGFAFER